MDGIVSADTRSRALGVAFTILIALLGPTASAALAQPSQSATAPIEGLVVDPDENPVAGARVRLTDGDSAAVLTDSEGRFRLEAPTGRIELRIEHPAFRPLVHEITTDTAARSDLTLRLAWAISVEDSVTVVGIRADDEVPVTKTDLEAERIQELSYGQDVPALLEVTPSVTWYSDSGSGANYSYFSIRGIQQSRINITLDGAPLNDPIEHVLFFNNFHDLVSEVDSVQIQRGVGISTVGAPAYGGSVNFVSPAPSSALAADARLILGSFDTRRASVGVESGTLGDGFTVGGRLSYASTDGYREHSGNDHHTVFFHSGWRDDRSSLRLTGFLGEEEGQLAYLAVEPEILADNPRFNPLDEAEREDFGQDFAQLRYSRATGDRGLLNASLYYNRAGGYYLLWDDPVAQSALLEFGIDQSFWGTMVSYSSGDDRLWTSFGAHYSDFSGDHTLDVDTDRIYLNTGFKDTANAFAKAELRLGDTLLFGDLGFRWARFAYDGEIDLGSVDWTFLDPRVGVRHWLSDRLSLYGSLGRAQREPARLDLLAGEDNATVMHDLGAVRPETVVDIELGVGYRTTDWQVNANLYAMEFTDEIALTGELSDVGLPLRRNVDDSYRRGIELDARWRPSPRWSFWSTLNLSRNEIASWTQFTDVYGPSFEFLGSRPITYRDVPPLLTPERVANLGAEWRRGDLTLAASLRHVGQQHLDNTGIERFKIPSFTNVDLRAAVGLESILDIGRPRLRVFVNNLFDEADHWASGYSYQFLNRNAAGDETLDGIPFYYPLADRNVMVTLEAEF